MLKIYGNGPQGFQNGGYFKVYNNFLGPRFIGILIDDSITSDYGNIDLPDTLSPVASFNGGAIISSINDRREVRFYSGSAIYRPWVKVFDDGRLDTNFTGSISGIFNGYLSDTKAIVSQSDGKFLLGYDAMARTFIQRINSDFSVDETFRIKNALNDNSGNGECVAVQSDGKVIAAGSLVTKYSGSAVYSIFRTENDGRLDNTFDTKDGFYTSSNSLSYNERYPFSMKIQNDGKIVAVGTFNSYYDSSSINIGVVRINSNGTIDSDFKTSGGFSGSSSSPGNNVGYVCDIQSDGKILIGGNFIHYSGSKASKLIRVDISGSLDPTFNTGSGFSSDAFDYVTSIKVLSDGKILVGGYFSGYSGSAVNSIVRLNSSGSIDTSFISGNGFSAYKPTPSTADSYAVISNFWVDEASNKIYVRGNFSNYSGSTDNRYFGRVIRLNQNGSVDESFNTSVFYSVGFGDSINKQFNRGIIKKQSDGKYVIAQNFDYVNSSSNRKNTGAGIFRLNSDLTFDTSFNPGSGLVGVGDPNFDFQTDGKIILVSDSIYYSGSQSNRIVRVNTDGTKDNTYNTGSGLNNKPYVVSIQSDNKAIVGGTFTSYSGSNTNRIVRINTDGTKDNTFITGSGFDNTVFDLKIQSDGKILVAGQFTNYSASSVSCTGSVRLNSDGTVDTSFNVGTGFTTGSSPAIVRTIVSQSDGKIMFGGNFQVYSGSTVGGIVRVNSDGTIDTSFNGGGTRFNTTKYYPKKIIQTADGNYVVLLSYSALETPLPTYNSQTISNVVGLSNNGSFIFSFRALGDIGNYVGDVIQLSDDKIILVGQYSEMSGSYVGPSICKFQVLYG